MSIVTPATWLKEQRQRTLAIFLSAPRFQRPETTLQGIGEGTCGSSKEG